eukprot:1034883-Pyramimonas_sp.AAC.1
MAVSEWRLAISEGSCCSPLADGGRDAHPWMGCVITQVGIRCKKGEALENVSYPAFVRARPHLFVVKQEGEHSHTVSLAPAQMDDSIIGNSKRAAEPAGSSSGKKAPAQAPGSVVVDGSSDGSASAGAPGAGAPSTSSSAGSKKAKPKVDVDDPKEAAEYERKLV